MVDKRKTAPVTGAATGQSNTSSPPAPPDQPPRLVVCLNAPVTSSDFPDRTTLGATDAGASPQGNAVKDDAAQLLTAPVLKPVFDWIHDRLTKTKALWDAWQTAPGLKDDARFASSLPDNGKKEEDVARAFPELFLGCPYGGPNVMYAIAGLADAAKSTAYIYQRFQKKAWDWNDMATRKKMAQWSPKRDKNPDWKPEADAIKTNTDPAYPIVVACEHLATYVLLALGFVIETDMLGVGLSAADDSGRELFKRAGGKWYKKSEIDVTKLVDTTQYPQLDVPPRAGTVYAFDPMQSIKSVTVYLTDEEAFQAGSDGKPDKSAPDLKRQAAIAKARLDKFFSANKGTTVADYDGDKTQYNISVNEQGQTIATPITGLNACTVQVSAQIQGSHAQAAIRVAQQTNGKTAVQLFNTSGSPSTQNDEHSFFRPIGYGGIFDDDFVTTIRNKERLVGVGVPPPAPDPDSDWLRKARPVGLARFLLLRRSQAAGADSRTLDDVVYVSRLLRMWGDDSYANYGYAKYAWSLRNIPYYAQLEPHWILFVPRDALAGAMWAMGARSKSMDDFNAIVQKAAAERLKKQNKTGTPDGNLVVQRDYLPMVGITCNAKGLAECTFRYHSGSDAGTGSQGSGGTLPQLVKVLVMGGTSSRTNAKNIGWNQEYFHPKWANTSAPPVE
jgi:hypothetical protein